MHHIRDIDIDALNNFTFYLTHFLLTYLLMLLLSLGSENINNNKQDNLYGAVMLRAL